MVSRNSSFQHRASASEIVLKLGLSIRARGRELPDTGAGMTLDANGVGSVLRQRGPRSVWFFGGHFHFAAGYTIGFVSHCE